MRDPFDLEPCAMLWENDWWTRRTTDCNTRVEANRRIDPVYNRCLANSSLKQRLSLSENRTDIAKRPRLE